MSSHKRNIITGIVVLTALGMLVWMILTFSGGAMRLFKPRGTPVVFLCDRADGLSDGSPVFFKGVEVGKVTHVIRLADNRRVQIEGELDNIPPLPKNLIGEIKTQSQLGTSCQIDLVTSGEAEGALTPGTEIKLRFVGQSIFPPEFSDMMAQANKQNLVKHVDDVLVSLRVQVEKVGKVMESTQELIGDPKVRDDLNVAMANIRAVTERANTIAARLETLTKNADTTVTAVKADVDRLTLKIGDDLDVLGQSFKQFQEISTKINNGKGTAGALINDPKLYDELALTAKQLNTVAMSLSRLVDQWEHEGVSIKAK